MKDKKSIFKNTFFSVVKTTASIIFPLITFPYISRTLTVEDIGKIEFSRSIVSYFLLLASLGINTYAIREGAKIKDDTSRLDTFTSQIFTLNLYSMGISISILLALILYFPYFNRYQEILLVLSLNIIGTTLSRDWLNSVFEDFRYITIRNIIIQFISLILMFIFVRKESDYLNYSILLVFSSIGAALLNFFYSRSFAKIKVTKNVEIHQHIKPIMLIFAINISTIIYVNLDVTILNFFNGDFASGIYSSATKIYTLLKNIVAAIIIVMLPRLSHMVGNSSQKIVESLTNKMLTYIILFVFPISIVTFFCSESIITFLMSEKFLSAAPALRLFSLALIFSSIASFMTTSVLLPHGGENKILFASVISAFINLLLNLWLIPIYGYNGAAFTTTISEFIMMILSYIFSKKYIEFKNQLLSLLIGVIGIIPFVALGKLASILELSGIYNIIFLAGIGTLLYLLLVLTFFKISPNFRNSLGLNKKTTRGLS